MRAEDIAEDFPVVTVDSNALDAARMLAEHRLPGIVVTDKSGRPYAVLHASQAVRFNESMADRAAEKLAGKTVGDLLPEHLLKVPPANADDTIIEVAAE